MVTVAIVKSTFELLASCLIYSLIIVLIDIVLILLFRQASEIASSLSFILLVEGGVGLTVGGITAFFSPLAGKIEEVIFHSEPWSAVRQKETEKQARTWIVTGSILVIVALLVSAF
jgi:hypothetical protein